MAASYSLSAMPSYSMNAGGANGAWGNSNTASAVYGANGGKSTVDEFDVFSSRPGELAIVLMFI